MEELRATFEIESESDAHAVERLLNHLHDLLREESRITGKETSDSSEMLTQFETLRDAARSRKPGSLTVVFEQRDRPFEESQ
jgi:hypothetical protein